MTDLISPISKQYLPLVFYNNEAKRSR